MLADQFSQKSDAFSEYKDRVAKLSSDFEIGLFFYLLKKSVAWIALFFVIAVSSAYLYLRYTPQVFESKTIMQISAENEATKILNVQNAYENQNDIARSIELLRSKVFFRRALSTLPLKITYFAEGTFRSNEHYGVNAYTAETDVQGNINGVKIYVHFENESGGTINYFVGKKINEFNFKTGEWLRTPEMNLKIKINNWSQIQEDQNAVKENKLFFIVNDFDNLANQYYSRLNVRLLNDAAKTIEISFQDNNAVKAAAIVSAMANEFIGYDIEKKGESANKVLAFLDDQIAVVGDHLRNAETSIYSFKKDNKVSDSKNIADAGSARLNGLEEELFSLELNQNVLAEVQKNIEEKKDVDTYSLVSLLTGAEFGSALTGQINALQELLKTRENALYDVTPTSEKIKSIEYQIGVQKKLLVESIRSIKDKLQIRRENLEKKIKEMEAQYYSLPSEEVEYSRLQRLFSIN